MIDFLIINLMGIWVIYLRGDLTVKFEIFGLNFHFYALSEYLVGCDILMAYFSVRLNLNKGDDYKYKFLFNL